MAKQAKRVVYNSSLTKSGWVVTSEGRTVSRHASQKEAEAAAMTAAREVYESGRLAQTVLHKSDGTIREERTYGNDPERYPG